MAGSSIRDNMAGTIQQMIQGFNTLDYDTLRATRSEDFVYQFLPRSLGSPPRTNEEYREFFHSQLAPSFQKFTFTPIATTFDVDAKKATIYGNADVETVIGPASIEFVMMLSFNEQGDKISRLDEFFDSAVYISFFAQLQKFASEQAGSKG